MGRGLSGGPRRHPEQAADILEANHEEYEGWLVREAGSAKPKAEFETMKLVLGELRVAAGLASAKLEEDVDDPLGRRSTMRRVPIGVVGVIAPFNFPGVLGMRSIAPALALGNAVVMKPDHQTPVSGGLFFAALLAEAGLPAGLLQVVPGGPEAGEAICSAPEIGMVSFTGSTAVGRKVGALAGGNLKRVALELGGNNAFIVLDDAPVDGASSAGAWGSFLHQGQICMASGRHIVHESIADEYVAALAERAGRLPAGDPNAGQVALGPLINGKQLDRVDELVGDARDAGATVHVGGEPQRPFYPATVLSGVTPEMRVWSEEIFGPVAPVMTFSTDEEAIALANDTDYGLASGIYTSDKEHGRRIAAGLRTGLVHIGDQTVGDDPRIPFGGMGASGQRRALRRPGEPRGVHAMAVGDRARRAGHLSLLRRKFMPYRVLAAALAAAGSLVLAATAAGHPWSGQYDLTREVWLGGEQHQIFIDVPSGPPGPPSGPPPPPCVVDDDSVFLTAALNPAEPQGTKVVAPLPPQIGGGFFTEPQHDDIAPASALGTPPGRGVCGFIVSPEDPADPRVKWRPGVVIPPGDGIQVEHWAYAVRLHARGPYKPLDNVGIIHAAIEAGLLETTEAPGGGTSWVAECTKRGSARGDVLIGTAGDDVLCGFGGNDILAGRGGDDVVLGSAGRDIALGGRGSDIVVGGYGDDLAAGGRGNDTVYGGWGWTFAADPGPMGDDSMPSDGADLVFGGRGDDSLFGGYGPDTLRGGAGTNTENAGFE